MRGEVESSLALAIVADLFRGAFLTDSIAPPETLGADSIVQQESRAALWRVENLHRGEGGKFTLRPPTSVGSHVLEEE